MKSSTYLKPNRRRFFNPVLISKNFYLKILKNSLYLLLPISLILILLFAVYTVFFNTSILNLKKENIEIYGAWSFINEKDFKEKVYSYVLDKNILKIDTKDLENKLISDFKAIKTVSINKNIPPHLVITVEERTPYFALYKDSIEQAYMIAQDGYILGKVNDRYKDLFKIQYLGDLEDGNYIDSKLVDSYKEILDSTGKTNLTMNNIVFGEDLTYVYLSNKVVVIISNKKGVQDSFKIVSSILSKLNTETKKVSKIDLRYEKVIVSYN